MSRPMLFQEHTDLSTWVGHGVQLVGAGGVGFLIREVVKRMFDRADRKDDVAAGLRAEMLRRLDALEHQQAELEKRERAAYERSVALEAENRLLRRRYHGLLNWIAQQPGLPNPPAWLYDQVPGPTDDEWRRATSEGRTES